MYGEIDLIWPGTRLRCGEKAKSGQREKNRRAERAKRWTGEGERAAEPGDMPLISPFHDTRFWYHALIGQMASC